MPTSLCTGIAGFLGSHVADELIKLGHKIVGVDDLSGGFVENIPIGTDFFEVSITDHESIENIFRLHKIDYVYHLGAYAAEGLSHFIKRFNYTNNLIGSVNLINAAVNHKVKCFVFASSIAVYGSGDPPFLEEMVPSPEDSYGIAKLAVEQELWACRKMFGLKSIVFRPHNVYGERQNIADPYRNVVGIFMNQLLHNKPMTIFGDGTQRRAFSYISDVTPIVANSVNVPAARNQTFNIGAEKFYTVNQLAKAVAKAMGKPCKTVNLPERHEAAFAYCDHFHADSVFGERKKVSLDEGLKRMAAWVKKHGAKESKPFTDIEITKNMPPSWRKLCK